MQTAHEQLKQKDTSNYVASLRLRKVEDAFDKQSVSLHTPLNIPPEMTSGIYYWTLAWDELAEGSYVWDCHIKVQPESRVLIVINLPENLKQISLELQGTVSIGHGAFCEIAYASYRSTCFVQSTLEYCLEEGSTLQASYLLNHRSCEDFRELFIVRKNATLAINAFIYATESQKKIFRPKVQHVEAHSSSQTRVRSILCDQAYASLSGLIDVQPGASCDTHYHNKNLLLSPQAKLDAEPQLAIFFDDLSCSHGVAIGPLDFEQIFYLCARGLSPAEAQRLILKAFVAEVLEAAPQKVQHFIDSFCMHDMMESI